MTVLAVRETGMVRPWVIFSRKRQDTEMINKNYNNNNLCVRNMNMNGSIGDGASMENLG